jgi:4-hydroxy-tetrahydrodipicolinate synthase
MMASELPLLSGVLPVLPTPFAADGAVDEAAMRRVVAFALAAGAHGLVFPGVASEFNFLSHDERTRLVRLVGAAAAGRPFVVGASAETVEEVAALMAEGAAAGATAAMVMAPAGVGADPEALVAFFAAAAAGGKLPIVLQNAPPPVGSGLPIATILAVAARVPQIAWVKEETLPPGPRISALIAGAPASLKGVIGGGGARYFYDELVRGAAAAMPAAEITDVHVALFEAFRAGDRSRARAIYIRTLPLLLVQLVFRMVLTKQVLVRRNVFDNAAVRAPLPQFDGPGLEEIDLLLDELGDLLTVKPGTRR